MSSLSADLLRPERLIKARAIYSMAGRTYRSIAIRGAEIAAASAEPGGLDYLAGPGTKVVDAEN